MQEMSRYIPLKLGFINWLIILLVQEVWYKVAINAIIFICRPQKKMQTFSRDYALPLQIINKNLG